MDASLEHSPVRRGRSDGRYSAIQKEKFLSKPAYLIPLIATVAMTTAQAAPRIDNVLVHMVPPGATSLVGAHMDQVIASDLYRKLIAQQKLAQLDAFARDTGFDPRRDVREVLLVTIPKGSVLAARGTFNLKQDPVSGLNLVRHGQYNIRMSGTAGFCILDSSLAVAGDLAAVEASLDEWQSGSHKEATALLNLASSLDPQVQLWGVSTGFATFLAASLPRTGNGIEFSALFKGIDSMWFSASVTSGLDAAIYSKTTTEQDAITLRDTAKGLIGLGRLSVPQGNSDLLRLWDGITVDQTGPSFTLKVQLPGNLVDTLIQLFSGPAGGRGATGGRGGRGGSGRRLANPPAR
jgi:hypothetical protein